MKQSQSQRIEEAMSKRAPEGMRYVVVTMTRSNGKLVGHSCLIFLHDKVPTLSEDEHGSVVCDGCKRSIA